MARIAIMAAIAALELVLVPPASAHCYSVWKYPWRPNIAESGWR